MHTCITTLLTLSLQPIRRHEKRSTFFDLKVKFIYYLFDRRKGMIIVILIFLKSNVWCNDVNREQNPLRV